MQQHRLAASSWRRVSSGSGASSGYQVEWVAYRGVNAHRDGGDQACLDAARLHPVLVARFIHRISMM